jgi:mRNA interferase MazF
MNYNFAEVVLVPFPFTDQSGLKRRPAVIVSSDAYNLSKPDLVLMGVTSQIRKPLNFGEIEITQWQKAGLLKPSVIKSVITTVENNLIFRRLGKLEDTDTVALQNILKIILG